MSDASQLRGCQLFIFDLDGTVYEEIGHFEYYGEELAKRLAESVRQAFFSDVALAQSGQHAMKYGCSYDVEKDIFHGSNGTKTWTGEVSEAVASGNFAHVDDPWGLYGVIAAHYGLSQDGLQEAFYATRAHMQSEAFSMTGLPGLRAAIDALRNSGVHVVLATNSPEPDSRAILEKLGLTGAFDDCIFNAQKPVKILEHFEKWHQMFQVPYESMVSIGDHYRNEIEPAAKIGMKTIYIDRYVKQPREHVTVQVNGPRDIAAVLMTVVETSNS